MIDNKKEIASQKEFDEIMEKAEELLYLMVHSDVYGRYQKELEELKHSEKLYDRMNEYRKKSLALQLWKEPNGSYDKMQDLFTEYQDVLGEPMVSRFMLTEQSMCKILRKVQNKIFDGIQLDISYLD